MGARLLTRLRAYEQAASFQVGAHSRQPQCEPHASDTERACRSLAARARAVVDEAPPDVIMEAPAPMSFVHRRLNETTLLCADGGGAADRGARSRRSADTDADSQHAGGAGGVLSVVAWQPTFMACAARQQQDSMKRETTLPRL